MKRSQKLISIGIQVLITLMLLYSIALAVKVDITRPWHYLSQIAKTKSDLTTIDADENRRIDAGIIEDTLQDITNNGATTTHTINVGGLNSAGAIIASGNLNIGSGKLFVDVSTGRVGIGTASPTAKLDVSGDIKISGSITGSGNLNIGSGKLFVDVSTGKVGIGTTSPHGKLGIKQGNGDWITLERTAGSGYWHIRNPSGQERITIGYTSDSGVTQWDMFVIKNNGNVGIGTPNPQSKLEIFDQNAHQYIGRYDPTCCGGSQIPSGKFRGFTVHWDSDLAMFGLRDYGSDRKDVVINNEQDSDNIRFQIAGDDKVIIKGNGNVGIGTTNPQAKLDVAGYVKGRDGLCIGNDCRTSWPEGGGIIDSSLSTNGYIKFSNGLIIQWGEFYCPISSVRLINLPISFTHQFFSLVVTPKTNSDFTGKPYDADEYEDNWVYYPTSLSQFRFYNGFQRAGPSKWSFIAIGY